MYAQYADGFTTPQKVIPITVFNQEQHLKIFPKTGLVRSVA